MGAWHSRSDETTRHPRESDEEFGLNRPWSVSITWSLELPRLALSSVYPTSLALPAFDLSTPLRQGP